MNRSPRIAFVGAAAVAALAAGVAFGVPAWQRHQDRAFLTAGQHALADVRFPAAFTPYVPSHSTTLCAAGPTARCFAAAGDPRDQVAAMEAALAPVMTKPVKVTCQSEPISALPDRCTLTATVHGGRLRVFLFANAWSDRKQGAAAVQWHTDGSIGMGVADSR